MYYDETDDANFFLPTTPNELSETLPINSLYLQPLPISDMDPSQTKWPAQVIEHLQEQECKSQLQSLDNVMEKHDKLIQEQPISILPENIPQQVQSRYDNNGSQQFQCPSQSSGFQCQNLFPEIEDLLSHDAQASKANSFTLDRSFLTLDVSMFSDSDVIGQEEPHYQQNKVQHKPEQQQPRNQESQETQQKKEQHQIDFCVEPQQEKVRIVNIKVHIQPQFVKKMICSWIPW